MIRPFLLHRPSTIDEAAALLLELPAAAVYRGGTELLQLMKMGLAWFDHLIDLKRIPALHGISVDPDGSVRIGSGTTHHEIERSAALLATYPAFTALERHVANVRVRSVGSLGGNLCFAEPHSDPATFLLAAGARLEIQGPSVIRTASVDTFILDALTPDLRPGEVLVGVVLPPVEPGTALAYRRIALAERPVAAVACRLATRDGIVLDARLAVGSVGLRPELLDGAASVLVGTRTAELDDAAVEAAARAAESCEVVEEPSASAEYQRHLVGVLARRAVLAAAETLHGC